MRQPLDRRPRPGRDGDAGLARRSLLLGGGLIAIGALAGAGVQLASRPDSSAPRVVRAPTTVRDAYVDEARLLAAVTAALRSAAPDGSARRLLAQLRDDHREHLSALAAAVRGYGAVLPRPASSPTGTGVAAIRDAERRAARLAGERALRLTGVDAVLLADIAACEATHVEVLR